MGNLHLGGTALKPLVILGATGSIGRQAVEVAHRVGAPIAALAANSASDSLLEMGEAHPEAIVCVADPQGSEEHFRSVFGPRVRFGTQSVTEVAALGNTTVLNGIVGAAGLEASLSALNAGNRLALANKESLVAGGSLLTRALADGGGELIPVDSEHSAIWQCIHGENVSHVKRLILTASGGPFRGRSRSEMVTVSVAEALAHPTWEMGPRITTDSATLMNKAFEVIEAHHLFSVGYDDIDVVIHPQSVVHSFVEFDDGVVKAELGFPDMRKPIQAAITYPERVSVPHQPFDLVGTDLTFEAPDLETFPCLALGYEAGRLGGTATAVLNAADEIAVAAFLAERIAFLRIADVVAEVLGAHDVYEPDSVAGVGAADAWARSHAEAAVTRFSS
ncbi:MAG: 1-deoxy-D-xylulose-5-phosphate reductoisomerase [Actinomycetota bacterium]|nr:1-deoxy-D-xylulose-5-phosphate reductoisomerase [Actinomycetota bacterium]